ncbi:ribonuclease P protein component [Lysobacter enzymogenes]|uniref:ribonuclease P protein component n=1 Tax=Lysobacter enzymogenes TaxID=69 RepID=UPI0019D06FC1|nr:ribonuclease P protein component [Lysobacter enzymogenes]MBN7138153.1 ribonuclease P protein component [Lysobacter enzymogenes]
MTSSRFPRTARVRARSDFDRIFKHGRRVALPVLALHFQADPDLPARLGLAVSRKVDPNAVGRNRIKRILRDAFRHLRAELAPGDYVLVARPGASKLSGPELRAAFEGLLKRAGARSALALPETAATGTMPAASPSHPLPDPGPG